MRLTSKRAVTVGEIEKAEGMTSTVDVLEADSWSNQPEIPRDRKLNPQPGSHP